MSFHLPCPPHPFQSVDVAIVGASGLVGQKVLALSSTLPWIRIKEIAGSNERIGSTLSSCPWRETLPLPHHLSSLRFCAMDDVSAPYILSCLPNDIAEIYEPLWTKKGHHVFSNASTFRMDPDIPLLIPEINSDHLSLVRQQSNPGKQITNPNCSATALACALAPIVRSHSIRHISIVTMQSISGAGYPGVPSMDILGNTIPDIPGEAEKIVMELKKILGSATEPLCIPITANVHRVPVLYGHVATIHMLLDTPPVTDMERLYLSFHQHTPLFMMHHCKDRPQARRDLSDDDMRIHMGPIHSASLLPQSHDQTNSPFMIRFNILSHNLVRGAAGAVLANLACFLRSFQGLFPKDHSH